MDIHQFKKRIRQFYPLLSADQKLKVLSWILDFLAKDVLRDGSFAQAVFNLAEEKELHITPTHYYSPIPDFTERMKAIHFPLLDRTSPLHFNAARHQFFLKKVIARWHEELVDIPLKSNHKGQFHWANGMFPPGDATLYYSMIREYQPKRIIEIGSGMSTLIASMAALKNKTTVVEAIEPYPIEFFNQHLKTGFKGLTRLIEDKVQNVPLSVFKALEPNDILFIDSSHVAKASSDVNFIFFKILPCLKSGVLIHFHDIFLPYDYPEDFFEYHKRFFNEEYLLAAFLFYNKTFEVIFANHWFMREFSDDYVSALTRLFSPKDGLSLPIGGGSFWMRKH